ncbi:hypothetical protein BDW68DRAFT_163346 [Aspergillus falconensis]
MSSSSSDLLLIIAAASWLLSSLSTYILDYYTYPGEFCGPLLLSSPFVQLGPQTKAQPFIQSEIQIHDYYLRRRISTAAVRKHLTLLRIAPTTSLGRLKVTGDHRQWWHTGSAMRSENDHSKLSKDSGDLRFGIVYPIICIICALVLARRIRRRQRTKYILPMGQMDTPSEKHGGEQSPGPTNLDISYSTHVTHHRAPLPSACDILQPLSHSTPLPSSGYLAAALREERRNRMEQAHQLETGCVHPTSSDCTTSGDFALVAFRTDCNLPSGTGNSPTPTDDSSQATPRPITPLPTGMSADVAVREYPRSLGSGETRSVQKRGENVEFLRDVDEEGARTWRRWVIEYS